MNGLALCSGVGGLERGIESVFKNYRTVCHVEGEAYAVACLISQMAKGWVDEAPIWSNLRTFDGKPWSGKVDIISSGFPCQPFSKAGKQKGKEDDRHLWPDVFRIIGEIRPGIVILENVPSVIKHIGTNIFGDLAELGYYSSWGIVRASDAKAPHRRERFFSISFNSNTYNDGLPISIFKKESYDRIFKTQEMEGSCFDGLCSNVSNTNSDSESDVSFDVEKGRFIFESNSIDRRWQIKEWKIEPRVDRVVDGVENWMDRMRVLGNGVVPQQASLAIEILISQLNDFIQDSKHLVSVSSVE